MAEQGMTALLTAYRLPPHGDQRAKADAVRTAVHGPQHRLRTGHPTP